MSVTEAARHVRAICPPPQKAPAAPPAGSQRYVLLDKIGRGGFGYVYRALDRTLGRVVAAKLIDLEEAGDEMEDVQQEIAVMSTSHCPQLTEYYTSFVSDNQLWIIMEHLEAGSLSDIMKDFGPLSEPSCAYVIRELLMALVYLHRSRKIHRDIKAGNILVSATGLVKLSDFGVTGQLTDSMNKRKTRVGTPFWMAPEVITETSYDENADIWSVGITAIELAHGFPPHAQSMHPMQVIFLIPKKPPPVLEGEFSDSFKDFVAKCLVKDPVQRPSSLALLSHPFLLETALTDELRAWAQQRVLRQEESLKAAEAEESSRRQARAGAGRSLLRKEASRSRDLSSPADPIGDLRTLEAGRLIDRPAQPDFDYMPPAPLIAPIKWASLSGQGVLRGPGKDSLAAPSAGGALPALNGCASPLLSPRSECDVSYTYSMESGHDADSNNTSGWDFDLTIKTRNSQGSHYSYSYSGKNFPDLASMSAEGHPHGISDIIRASSAGNSLLSPQKHVRSGSNTASAGFTVTPTSKGHFDGPLRRSVSIDSSSGVGGKRSTSNLHPLADAAAAALEGTDDARFDTDAVVIEESTIQQYNDLNPPMTDAEAFSAVFGVLSRFKWQFVDRSPHTSDLPPGTDPLRAKQMRRTYRQYIKNLDATMAQNPGGVEYSRESPLRPSGLYKEVVLPAMGGVGSAAAILLATDLTGGSGLAGLEPVCFHRHESREKGGELPVTPLANCVVVDLLAPSTGNSNSLGSVKCKSKGIETQELDSSSAANRSSSISDHGAGGMRLTGSGELPLPIPRSGSGPAELDTFSTADALLNHLYTSAVPSLSSPQRRSGDMQQLGSIVEQERRRDRESRALLWALERCLLALDIQSSGGATSEVLSTLMGYMMEEMEEGEDDVCNQK